MLDLLLITIFPIACVSVYIMSIWAADKLYEKEELRVKTVEQKRKEELHKWLIHLKEEHPTVYYKLVSKNPDLL